MTEEGKKKILLVEDEPDIVDMVTMRLEAEGYEVHSAQNGVEGLKKVKEVCPDVIVSDVVMPEMDGYHFYKNLKASKATEDIPVLILTAHDKMEDTFAVAGVDAFLPKPFDSHEFSAIVKRLASREAHSDAGPQGIRVLLAGDSQESIENMALQLKKRNYIVDLVTTGPQTISKTVLFLPQLLIIDVQMEGMPTEEVIRVLRQMPQSEKIPIITYSFYRVEELGSEDIRQKALSVGGSQQKCEEAGATGHLGRFNENTFVREVEKHINQNKGS